MYIIKEGLFYGRKLHTDMEKVSSNLAVLAENPEKGLEFGISPRRIFENANLLEEDFRFFPCLCTRYAEAVFR